MRSKDKGQSWSEPVILEPTVGPEASYAVIFKAPSGRIFCFYNYNIDNIREVKAEDPPFTGGYSKRVDLLGAYVMKYSDDHGLSIGEDVILVVEPRWDKVKNAETFEAYALHVWGKDLLRTTETGTISKAPEDLEYYARVRRKMINSVK